MEFDNDLGRSVWDDNPEENPFNELSRTFANLGKPADQEQPFEEEHEPEENESTGDGVNDVGITDKNGWHASSYQTPVRSSVSNDESPLNSGPLSASEPILERHTDKLELLGSLAPEEDPLHELTQTATLQSPKKSDPLFSGLEKSPLHIFDDNSTGHISSQHQPQMKTKSGKLNKLFSSARTRRHPIKPTQEKASISIHDPLVESLVEKEKNEQFVEESLADDKDEGKLSLEREMDSPLYLIAERKVPSYIPKTNSTMSSSNTQETIEKFQISVVDPMKIGDITSVYVEYTVISKSNLLEGKPTRVKRRYRDFRWLYRQLQHNHWGKIIPPPPEKQAVGRFKQDFIENRRAQMERMLQHIASNHVLQKDEDFILFLTSEKWSQESKVREQISGSKASHDSNDISDIHISELKLLGSEDAERVLKNGGLDTETGGSFMGLSFATAPKYKEPDQFFVDAAEKMDILEEQLKQLYKALELVDSQRSDLCSVINEFSETLKALADLELSNRTSDLLQNFAEVHLRIKESTSRSSMQDSLTLGITIDDNLRAIGSVKAVLNQRKKLGYYILLVENDLNKKQTQFNKVSGNSANSEKATSIENELRILTSRCNKIKQEWQTIAEVIRKDVNQHDVDTIEDFRNNMEIYLESAIESQKECIEIWETFYQNNL
ncbi:sorting nexin 1 [Kluyveromyces lactis]|uniref:KLLA0F16643p n=1 Tax=Kluyveromyces lactis (strain ATCC 8585 / CBS 2359 / DSM 70799 / NBRC 1267 / NRRL Y-1140 / WM37) TaxID=284590 RepID=Q6CJR1_KLULA|nr:uncharacterized protein KLLA0_F16643g [Kluyveromyces lactis]CAG98536.1 KLLA0F16643p [Kluyveromyces lactis]|eukprot:XP_455828.1 uncharacterized protein KLLA0_F16643g [Kluyveromyces lactis]